MKKILAYLLFHSWLAGALLAVSPANVFAVPTNSTMANSTVLSAIYPTVQNPASVSHNATGVHIILDKTAAAKAGPSANGTSETAQQKNATGALPVKNKNATLAIKPNNATTVVPPNKNATNISPVPVQKNGTQKASPDAGPKKRKMGVNSTGGNGTDNKEGWISVSSGARPVYVGIHGGTAPLSLVRASNGTLIALTGQTGNDFVHVLKGSGHNSSLKNNATAPAETGESKAPTEPATGQANATDPSPQKTGPAIDPSLEKKNTVSSPASLNSTASAAKKTEAPSATQGKNATQPQGQPRKSKQPASTEGTPAEQQDKPANLNNSAGKKMSSPQPSSLPQKKAEAKPKEGESPSKDMASELAVPYLPKASGTQPLIIATGSQINQLGLSGEPLLPFGLSEHDRQEEEESSSILPSPPPSFRKLKLGSYQAVVHKK